MSTKSLLLAILGSPLSSIQNQKKNESEQENLILIDFSLTVKVATLIFIPGRGSAISSAQ